MQILSLTDFHAGKPLQHIQHTSLINSTFSDLLVAVVLGLKVKIVALNVGRKRRPEARIIHRLQPFIKRVQISEVFHAPKIPVRMRAMQNRFAKRDWL